MSKQKTSHKPLFPQQQFTPIKASINSPYPSKLDTSEISIESKLQQQMLHNIKATSETTLLNQSFNKCFKPSKLLQKPLLNQNFNKCFKPPRLHQKPLY
jgi:hypothetical protein